MWQEGRIPFHKKSVNADLIKYWSLLNLPPQATVLVPLCGKSLDLLWLAKQGFHVLGIELSELAVQQFAQENHLSMIRSIEKGIINYSTDRISLWVADFFQLNADFIPKVDAIYDRASLIALPAELRQSYVNIYLQWLKQHGKILLKTMDYKDDSVAGPPFSVTQEEVYTLYKSCQAISCIKSDNNQLIDNEHLRMQGVQQLKDYAWIIQN